MITLEDLLKGRDAEYPLSDQLHANVADLLIAANNLDAAYFADTGRHLVVGNAYRPGHYNVQASGAKRSAHLICLAIDWEDGDGAVDAWLAANPDKVVAAGFVGVEHPDHTPGWAHTDLVQRYDQRGNPFLVFRVR